MNVVYCFADSQAEWNTSEWRGHIPSNGLNTHKDHTARMIPIQDFSNYGHDNVQAVLGPADIIVVQRNLLAKPIWDACDYWRLLGKIVVADLDDDYPHLTPQNPAYKFWILDAAGLERETGFTPIQALTEGFKHVDALISPNELILSDWSEVVRGYWQPNYAHWPWYKDIKQKMLPQGEEPIVIGWGGSVSHWDSWWFSGLREAVPELTAKYPRIMWKVCGGDVRVKRWFDEMIPGRWIDQVGVPPDQWPQQVASFDIGLAPLCGPGYPQGERYDQRRSWLKAVEYLLTGVPWVASGGVVYEKLDGKGGECVENTPEAWFDTLSNYVEELAERKAESRKLMRWARDNLTMEHVVAQYVRVFETISTDKGADYKLRMPNVLYSVDYQEDVAPIEAVEITITDDDMSTLEEWQRQFYWLSTTWHKDVDLEFAGVDLATCLQYPVLQTVNQIAYEEMKDD